jgi:hypothetical protein
LLTKHYPKWRCKASRLVGPLRGNLWGQNVDESRNYFCSEESIHSSRLLQSAVPGIVEVMKRQLVALILLLAVTLQGSLVAFAGVSGPMSSDCATSVASASQAEDSCCPSGTHTVSCCQDACPAIAAVLGSPLVSIIWNARSEMALPFHIETFSTRGDSPLIRPPIL